jgi:hypothetical protein
MSSGVFGTLDINIGRIHSTGTKEKQMKKEIIKIKKNSRL